MTEQTIPTSRTPLFRSIRAGVLLGLVVAIVLFVINIFVGRNLHVVIPGQIYRSSQLSPEALDRFVRKFGVRTVINLRGFCGGQGWYLAESQACSRLNVSQEDLNFSAAHLPPVHEIRRLIEVMDRSEYPILFHCFRGVDRTGMATMMALLLKTDTPLGEARRSMDLRHLHLSVGRTGHLDRFFDQYEDWLKKSNHPHTPDRFRHWVLREYQGGVNTGRMELLGHVLIGPQKKKLPAPLGPPPTGANERVTIRVPSGIPIGIPVRFYNTSDEPWIFHPHDKAGVHAFWRFLDDSGVPRFIDRAGRFHARVEPGQHIDLVMSLPPLQNSGRVHLQVGLIEEQHCFFQEVGMDVLNIDLEVP